MNTQYRTLSQHAFRPDCIGIRVNSLEELSIVENASGQPEYFKLGDLVPQMAHRPCNNVDDLIRKGETETWLLPASGRNCLGGTYFFSVYMVVKVDYNGAPNRSKYTWTINYVSREEIEKFDFSDSLYKVGARTRIEDFTPQAIPATA